MPARTFRFRFLVCFYLGCRWQKKVWQKVKQKIVAGKMKSDRCEKLRNFVGSKLTLNEGSTLARSNDGFHFVHQILLKCLPKLFVFNSELGFSCAIASQKVFWKRRRSNLWQATWTNVVEKNVKKKVKIQNEVKFTTYSM